VWGAAGAAAAATTADACGAGSGTGSNERAEQVGHACLHVVVMVVGVCLCRGGSVVVVGVSVCAGGRGCRVGMWREGGAWDTSGTCRSMLAHTCQQIMCRANGSDCVCGEGVWWELTDSLCARGAGRDARNEGGGAAASNADSDPPSQQVGLVWWI
jgi:hypothetical protein